MEPEFTYIQQMQAENCEAEQPRSKDKEGPTSIEYLLKCPSYDPLKAPAEEVDHILSKRLTFDNDHSTLACFEFRKGDGHTSTDLRPLVTGATFERQDLNAVIFFVKWQTSDEKIFVAEGLFRRFLLKYQINPLFVLMLGFPNTGGASSSFSYVDDKPDSFHLCLRYPSLSLSIDFALYFQFNFATKQVCVIVLDGEIEGLQSHVGRNLQEVIRQHGRQYRPNPLSLHPFVYGLPFLQYVGNITDHVRNNCRDEVVHIERNTGTSVYGAQISSDILDPTLGQTIETLTRRAHICGANVAESQKYLSVHLRGVQEFIRGFHSFQERYYKYCNVDSTRSMIEAERVDDLLQLELDYCKGRQMELDNLVKRVDIQINMLFSLASQRDSRLNARIAEESKSIATETKKDSASMKTIAALTMVFLPGTFVSAILGMNFFNSDGAHFAVNEKWWIFVAATMPLTGLVFGVWYLWLRVERMKEQRQDEEHASTDELR